MSRTVVSAPCNAVHQNPSLPDSIPMPVLQESVHRLGLVVRVPSSAHLQVVTTRATRSHQQPQHRFGEQKQGLREPCTDQCPEVQVVHPKKKAFVR